MAPPQTAVAATAETSWIGRLPTEVVTQLLEIVRDEGCRGGKWALIDFVRLGHVDRRFREITIEKVVAIRVESDRRGVSGLAKLLAIEPRRAKGVQRLRLSVSTREDAKALALIVKDMRQLRKVFIHNALGFTTLSEALAKNLARNPALAMFKMDGPVEINRILKIFAGCPDLRKLDFSVHGDLIHTVARTRRANWSSTPLEIASFPRNLRSFALNGLSTDGAFTFVATILEQATGITSFRISNDSSNSTASAQTRFHAALTARAPPLLEYDWPLCTLGRIDHNFPLLAKCVQLRVHGPSNLPSSALQLPLLQTLHVHFLSEESTSQQQLVSFVEHRRATMKRLSIEGSILSDLDEEMVERILDYREEYYGDIHAFAGARRTTSPTSSSTGTWHGLTKSGISDRLAGR